ncbi:Pentatricopeptide repeat-containing protein At3g22690 [Linum perenne]
MAVEGNGERAIELFNEMLRQGIKPDGVVFVNLLTALSHGGRMHKNVKIAKYAAEKITLLDPERPGVHVLLSNIYASAGQWNDVAKMNCRLTDAGFVSDLTNVLLDVDEAEKQYLLSRHSEKLAMAFSLINTTTTMPIRVMKNLRICSDCHSFAKLVSRVYDREVIIRDNNRFHFFRQGSCSCGDYW